MEGSALMSKKNGYFFGMCPKVLYGAGCIKQVPKYIKDFGVRKVLIVSDHMIEKLGYIEKLCQSLVEERIECIVFAEVNSEPEDNHVERGLQILMENDCRAVIGIGGGSPMDAAKAIAIMATNPGKISNYEGRNINIPNDKLPLVCITTTAGTSSEVSNTTIILDTKRITKMVIKGEKVRANLAVCDPELTLTMPASITATTGLDALAHAIEGFLSKQSHPLTDVFAQNAINLIYNNLPIAYKNPDNIEARSNVMMGQLIAGMIMSNSSTASIHAMARPVGANFNISHGLSVAMFMPEVMAYTLPAVPEKFGMIAKAVGINVNGLSPIEAGGKAVDAVKKLCEDLKVPTLRQLGVDKEEFLDLLPVMLRDKSALNTHKLNPIVPSEEDCLKIYHKMIEK